VDGELLAFTRRLVTLRLAHPVFRRRRFLSGVDWRRLRWYSPAGTIITGGQWADPDARSVAIYLDGTDGPDHAVDGTLLVDDDFLVLVNAWWEPLDFTVPAIHPGQTWQAEIDTFDPRACADRGKCVSGDAVTTGPRSILVLRGPVPEAGPVPA
jgi:glycogen operon protein